MFSVTGVLIEAPITDKIRESITLSEAEKLQFLNLVSYFTPDEVEELRALL